MKRQSILVLVLIFLFAIPTYGNIYEIHTPNYQGLSMGVQDGGVLGNPEFATVDMAFVQQWSTAHSGLTHRFTNEFDLYRSDSDTLFTFEWSESEDVIGATLELGLAGARTDYRGDVIGIDGVVHTFFDLGWTPEGGQPIFITRSKDYLTVTLDLSNVLGYDHLPDLFDRKLNVVISDDTSVDYAKLHLQLVPVPSAVILGTIGLTFSGWLLKRKRMM